MKHLIGLWLIATLTLVIPDDRLLAELQSFCQRESCSEVEAEARLRTALDLAIRTVSQGWRTSLKDVGGTLTVQWDNWTITMPLPDDGAGAVLSRTRP